MKSFLTVFFFAFLCSNAIGFRLGNENDGPIKLTDLCQSSIFNYKTIQVNSFYAKKFNFTLEPVIKFAFDEELEFSDFFDNQEMAEKVNQIKEEYNNIIVRIYSENFVNNEKLQGIDSYGTRFHQLKGIMVTFTRNVKKDKAEEFKLLLTIFDKGLNFIKKLLIFHNNSIQPVTMKLEDFKLFIESLKTDEKIQTFAFKNDQISKSYLRKIVKIDRFIFNKKSDTYYDFESNGTIEYSINLPFENKEHKSSPCIQGDLLPPFFSEKTSN